MTKTLFFSLFLALGLGFSGLAVAVVGPNEGENGGSCLTDVEVQCTDTNAVCSEGSVCSCKNGYVDKAGLCRKQSGVLGFDCQDLSDCFDGNSMCSSGTCQCKAGYEPDSVSVCRAIEAETPSPCTLKCANGGICVVDPVDASQSCACPRNFTGPSCEVHILCVESPCPAGAQCVVNNLGERICNCPPEVQHTDCAAEPTPEPCTAVCENGGTCVKDTIKGDRCDCPQEFAGPTCQYDNLCLTEPCPEEATCVINDVGDRICHCPPDIPNCATEQCMELECSSHEYKFTSCQVPGAEAITRVEVTRKLSIVQCTYGQSYGPAQGGIWVDRGCRAIFNVCAATDSTTPTPTTTYETCSVVCVNGGTCVIDAVYGDHCDCPPKFTGTRCENNIDHCINNPCPNGATCLSDASSSLGYICICAGDFKGPYCDEADPLVTCRDTNRTLYLEQQPSLEERTICLPKSGGDVNAICIDETENLIYSTRDMDDTLIRIDDFLDRYCFVYFAKEATMPDYCITITAYEEDDQINRPWRNANATVCFVFNRKPEFLAPLEIRFNLPDMNASEIHAFSATDPDVHQVEGLTFSIEVSSTLYSNLFSLTSTTGPVVQLQTIKPEGIPADPFDIELLVKVKDNGIPALSDEKKVKVKFTDRQLPCDVNERPIYVHNEITIFPKEIGWIACQTENPDITFTSQGDNDLGGVFYVDLDTGHLYLNQSLQTGDYPLTVKAEIVQPIRVVTQVTVMVKIGNWLPNCSFDFKPFVISENAPADACSDTIYTCSNPSGKPVSCIDSGSELFRIDCLPNEAKKAKEVRFKFCSLVSLKHRVGQHTVNVILENEFGETPVGFEAIVENVNDRPELVKDFKYEFTVPEDFVVGDIIGTVTVTDPDLQVVIDPPETLLVEIIPPPTESGNQGSYPFKASLSDNQDYVTIFLGMSLNAAVSKQYQFSLKVTDNGGLSDSVPITVLVDNVNENPFCDPSNYQADLSVKDEAKTVVAILTCYDNDVEPTFERIVYEIIGDQLITEHFAVNSSGVVTLRRPLSDVTDAMVTVTVKVADARGLETVDPVIITVSIDSDFPPECSKSIITSSKSEATAENVCFTVESGCIEPVASQPLTFEIDSGNGLELFRLDNNAKPGNSIGLCTITSLKNRYGDWTVNVIAKSNFGTTSITIIISVTDINDPPQFDKKVYRGDVQENSQPGSRIIQVNATDPDSGGFGDITYISEDIESSPLFALGPYDGWVTVKEGASVDADIDGPIEYTFIVKAVDGGPPHDPVVSTQVVIRITDINDNSPNCEEPPSVTPLFLLTPIEAVVYKLICSDTDRSPEFRQLTYEIASQSVAGMFSIDAAVGTIRLEIALSRDTSEYNITVLVKDSTDTLTANSYELNIGFVVNNTVPARCTPRVITETIPETKPRNFCLQNQVECEDVTGGDSIRLTSSFGNGTKYLEIRDRKEGGNILFLSACIANSIKDSFGTYRIEGIVDNGLAETTVIWTFTVTNVNEPPKFDPPSYETSIPEDITAAGTNPIIAVTAIDPDESTPDETFRIAKVTAESINDAEFDGAFRDYIKFFETSKEFFVVVNGLNATIRNEYLFQVTAEDGVGLKATANVTIHITDVNEKPICNEASVYISTDILVDVGAKIGSVSCYDADIDPNNKELLYSITSGDQDGYFSMASDGSIIIERKLPRLRLYNDGKAILNIQVQDAGEPPLSTTVTVEITVDNKKPPVCNPVIQPPNIWVQGRCLTVTMGCSDPTLPGSNSHLAYSVSGNYTQNKAFETKGTVGAVFDLCYSLTSSGFYQIRVDVDNGLSIYTFKKVVEVRYEEATPIFTQSTFKKTVSEFTAENIEVLTASANSTKLIGDLLYSVLGVESTSGWSDYFTLDSSNGKVTTRQALKDLANTVMLLSVEVQDTISKLKSSALVEITVEDENEEPTCDITESELTIDVDARVGAGDVLSFSCSDPDVVPEYRQLSYSLTGSTNVQIYFKLVPETEKVKTAISLKSQLSVFRSSYDSRVNDSKSSYYVTLQVSDNGNPAKVYKKRLTVVVSLLPPPVEWEILELGYSHVFVSWKYNRADYYQITNSFQVKLRERGSDQFYSTNVLASDRRFQNVTGITDNTEYEIYMSAVTQYGTQDTPRSQFKTPEIPKLTKLIAILKVVDREYKDILRNPSSTEFKDYSKRITEGMDFSLKDSPGYVRSDPIRYRNGSLILEVAVYVNQFGDVENTRDLLAQIITSGYMGDVAVDSTFFVSSIDGGYVNVDTIELGNDNVYNGTDMSISCSITTAGYENDPVLQFWWTLNGNTIRPTSASRISTISYPGTVYPEIFMSFLEIKEVTPRDSGRYKCFVADSEERSSNMDIDVKVLSPPIVSLTPRSLTVDSGSDVTVICTLVEPLDSARDFRLLWYRNGSELQAQEGEEYSSNATTGVLQISRLAVTTIFGCRGHNDAGNGPLVESHVGVKPIVKALAGFLQCNGGNLEASEGYNCVFIVSFQVVKPCPPSTFRDIVWPETLPGMVAITQCPPGYSGEISRMCGDKGEWKLTRDNCVQDKIAAIKEQVKAIKDGSGTTTITESMKELHNATDNIALFGGDLRTAVDTLDDTAIASNATDGAFDTEQKQVEEIDSYLQVCSNLIDGRHQQTWDTTIEIDGYGANEVSSVAEKYLKSKAEQLSVKINNTFERVFDVKNIYAIIGKEYDQSITFPDRTRAASTLPRWVEDSATKVRVFKETFKDLSAIIYDCVYYRNLSNIVVKKFKQSGTISDVAKTLHFNSEIVGFNVQEKTVNLDPPVEIDFGLFDTNYSDPVCVFWDTVEKNWSPDGCYVDTAYEDRVKCKCNHLTNFAILMSPGKTPAADLLALSIISAVGCAISMFCLLVTLIVHIALWRIVKSDRAIILLNLCVALLIALSLFLGGVGRADNEDACTAIAVLLHYIFLVVFFLMLAEGIDIGVTIMYVFATKSRIKWLVPLSWIIPAVIVAISAGVTKLEGYGNETFCWLSTESGLIWAFVGPAAFVILVNFIIIIIVFRQMFTSSAMLTKSDKDKAKTSLRSLCVLLPIMGITWVFGVFSVNESLVAFQYIFAIFNSLQGFFIFLFHCFLNKQLRDAIKQRRARKKSLQSFEKSYKNQHSTGTGSTAYQTSEDKTKDLNTDSGSKLSSTSNPFLEADRQMKELVNKGKKTGNTFDKDANNKKLDKDKPPVDVALEDVKISNILRESEVMSGTAGISSILTTQPDTGRETRDREEERPADDKNKFRESKASTQTYDYAVEPSYSYSGGLQKPAGYEKLLPQAQQARSTGYDRIVRSDDNVSSGIYSGGQDRESHGRVMSGSRERIDENRDRSTGTSRSDDDYEARLRERQERINNVYMPYKRSAQVSQEIGASLPKKYDIQQAKKPEPIKKSKPNIKETGAVKKLSSKKKKEMEKDRSRMYQYQYPYEATYLGQQQQSRHSSLENMSGYYVSPGYSPYAGMQLQGQTGRPTHQHQQRNPYGWGNQQRRDYW